MVTQMSGPRGDGRYWPPVGGTIEVPEAEAAELCRVISATSHPIAVRVDKPKVETATPSAAREESRPGATEAAAVRAEPPAAPAAAQAGESVRRGRASCRE